ncbi:MAG: MFS transporter [Candidatus Thermoplasmatota archaeon]
MPRFPRNVVLLAVTSFLADISGEMLQAVFAFLLVLQGASGLAIGLTGGVSEAVGHLLKPVFGAVADRKHARRKPLVIGGYVLAALSRFGIALSTFWVPSLAFRSVDRVGKGMRTAPRDAILAESANAGSRGSTYGLHRAADTAGAVVGVSLALVGIVWFGLAQDGLDRVVLVAAFVGLSTLIPLSMVRDVDPASGTMKGLFEAPSPRYRAFLVVAGIFALGQVSYLFYILRASHQVGGPVVAVLLYLLFNIVYAALALPLGWLSDRLGHARMLAGGAVLFSASAILLTGSPGLSLAVLSFVLLGLAFAATDGVQRALAADLAGTASRSTRLGLFHMTIGIATIVGGITAGWLWDALGEGATFVWGAVLPLVALALFAGLGFIGGRERTLA